MLQTLYWDTVTPRLRSTLEQLMQCELFNAFRLVGGTALSLQLRHRLSVDIDLFTDATYGSVNFAAIDAYLRNEFPYVYTSLQVPVGMGISYAVGVSEKDSVKLDLYYTDAFIQPLLIIDGIRMATVGDIVAMKMEVVQNIGRKKDFWDLHELMDNYTFPEMMRLHEERYPYGHNAVLLRSNFVRFYEADNDFDPVCLKGKFWEVIKFDLKSYLIS